MENLPDLPDNRMHTYQEESCAIWFMNWCMDKFTTNSEEGCYIYKLTGDKYYYYDTDKMFKMFQFDILNN